MASLVVFIFLSVLVCAQARCRCFTQKLMDKAKPGAPCQDVVEKKEMENTFATSPDNVEYTLTYVADDLVKVYVKGVLISSDEVFPKKRYTLNYSGPCADIIANVTNQNPGAPKKGGAGMSILINHNGDVYGSAQQNSFNHCASPICADVSAETVRPLFAVGIADPVDECFFSPENCDFSEWEHAVVADQMLDRPLCEFVKMASLGSLPLNPTDGNEDYQARFGIKFHLPFCP